MLTSSQRAKLRGMAQQMDPIFNIGKNGVTDNLVADISSALDKRELIKIGVLKGAELDAKEALTILCEALNAEAVASIGSKLVIFRRSEREDIEHIVI